MIPFFDRDSFDGFLVDDSSHDGDASFQPSSTGTESRENSPFESLGAETESEVASTISSVYSKHFPHNLHLVFLIRHLSRAHQVDKLRRNRTRTSLQAKVGSSLACLRLVAENSRLLHTTKKSGIWEFRRFGHTTKNLGFFENGGRFN